MKNILSKTLKAFAILLFVGISYTASAQTAPAPPPPNGDANNGNNNLGGGAPIGGGLFILLGLGAAYGGRKLYNMRKKEELEG